MGETTLDAKGKSELLIALAPTSRTLSRVYSISAPTCRPWLRATISWRRSMPASRLFVQRRAQHAHKPEAAAGFDAAALEAALVERFGKPLTELSFARHVMAWLDAEAANAEAIDLAVRYAAWALLTEAGHAGMAAAVLLRRRRTRSIRSTCCRPRPSSAPAWR